MLNFVEGFEFVAPSTNPQNIDFPEHGLHGVEACWQFRPAFEAGRERPVHPGTVIERYPHVEPASVADGSEERLNLCVAQSRGLVFVLLYRLS